MSGIAVFDLDGTLLTGASSERLLVPYLLRRGLLRYRALATAAALAATLPARGRTPAIRRNKRYLAGADVAAVTASMEAFLAECLEARWRRGLVARLHSLRNEGRELHLLTGAPDVLAKVVARRFGMRSALGTVLETRDGLFTGRLAGPHWFGDTKREAVRSLARAWSVELTEAFGFADHVSDVSFLDCFGHPVAVAPDAGLRREAMRRGWEIMEGP